MLIWLSIGMIVVLVLLVAWRHRRRSDWQLQWLTQKITQASRSKNRDEIVNTKLLQRIYCLIDRGISAHNSVVAYKAVDLLKFAYGHGIVRREEQLYLFNITVAAIRSDLPEIAGQALEAYQLLLRSSTVDSSQIWEQLSTIATVAIRQKHPFILSKIARITTDTMLQITDTDQGQDFPAMLGLIQLLGLLALRRKDSELFLEINKALLEIALRTNTIADKIVPVINIWLHKIVNLNDTDLFAILAEKIEQLITDKKFSDQALHDLYEEWGKLAGVACMNPNSILGTEIIQFIFSVIYDYNQSMLHWQIGIYSASQVIKLAITQHGFKSGFTVFFPMLEFGRKLLISETKFGDNGEESRRQLLFLFSKECIALINFISRQDLMSSSGDIIDDIYREWLNFKQRSGSEKSIKRYCQFLYLLWQKINSRTAKRVMPRDIQLLRPLLITELDRIRLEV